MVAAVLLLMSIAVGVIGIPILGAGTSLIIASVLFVDAAIVSELAQIR